MRVQPGSQALSKARVLVTGATGFVGNALLPKLVTAGFRIRAVSRSPVRAAGDTTAIEWQSCSDIGDASVEGCDTLIHLAARVHIMRETAQDSLAAFRQVNVMVTERLARRAAAGGVRRFVFLSSIKVNGEETRPDRPFFADDVPAPEDAYGVSKYEAEQVLRQIAEETGMEVVVIRPPLVYGPGVKGNFRSMLDWLDRGVPLPLASLDNRRSFVGVDNLCDLILRCVTHPGAANQTFLVSDDQDLSAPDLLRMAADVLGRPARLWPFPPALLEQMATLLGKGGIARRLCGNLQVDIGKTKSMLSWAPPVTAKDGLRRILDERTAQ